MTKFALTAIIALAAAGPALAQSQLERSVGAAAGQYTVGELVQLKAASTIDNGESRVFLGNDKIAFSTSDIHNDRADAIFANIAAASAEDE